VAAEAALDRTGPHAHGFSRESRDVRAARPDTVTPQSHNGGVGGENQVSDTAVPPGSGHPGIPQGLGHGTSDAGAARGSPPHGGGENHSAGETTGTGNPTAEAMGGRQWCAGVWVSVSTPEMATDALAAARITRLVTTDTITAPLREAIIRRAYRTRPEMTPTWEGAHRWADLARVDDQAPWQATLMTCQWCAGVWVSFGVVIARRLAPGPWALVARALAIAQAAAIVGAVSTHRPPER